MLPGLCSANDALVFHKPSSGVEAEPRTCGVRFSSTTQFAWESSAGSENFLHDLGESASAENSVLGLSSFYQPSHRRYLHLTCPWLPP